MSYLIRLWALTLSFLLTVYYRLKSITIGSNVFFNNAPVIKKKNSAKIIIGNNVTINSNNSGYHLNMHSGCKLIADVPDAVIEIGDNTRVHGTCIHAFKHIKIGKNCLIAANTQIIDANGHMISFPDVQNRINTKDTGRPVIIEDDVWIGANCFVLGGVTIGSGSIISANSVVKNDIPKMCIAGGNPAIVIKDYIV